MHPHRIRHHLAVKAQHRRKAIMAIQEQDRALVEETKGEAKEQANEQQKIVIVNGPYRFPETAPWWRGTTSPLGLIFISIIVMIALVSFGIGASQSALN